MATNMGNSGPYEVVTLESGWILRVLTGRSGRAAESPCDFEVTSPAGATYCGVAATIPQLASIMDKWVETGECLGGRYLWTRALIIVRNLSVSDLADTLNDIISSEEHIYALDLVDAFGDWDAGEPETHEH